MNPRNPTILLTIDVEDWFQVENFKRHIPFSSWPNCELRVKRNTHRLLNLLDSYSGPVTTDCGCREKLRATFFVLGWIAERVPSLIREIHSRGHEVASHGYHHKPSRMESVRHLERELSDSKKLLEDITGAQVFGYRAPGFSVNYDVLSIVEACGYLYDSSYNSFWLNKKYGSVNLRGKSGNGVAIQISGNFYEIPISNLRVGKFVLPLGGGGYFRVIPFSLFKMGVQWVLNREKTFVLYMHPWEIDPKQPKCNAASTVARFRQYINLRKTFGKMCDFLYTFNDSSFVTCQHYISQVSNG